MPGSSPSGPQIPGPALTPKQQKIYNSLTPSELGIYSRLDNNGKVTYLEGIIKRRMNEKKR